jgi:uncharacterized repeat protein (TIGR01451 family)
MLTTLKRLAFVGLFLLPLVATPASAQTPTPEGTVIKNKATATFTDANSNTYSSVSDSVSVTVGYLAAPLPVSPASVTPASPSSGNTLLFVLHNNGNGTDTMTVNTTVNAAVTITQYRVSYNAGGAYTTYATQALMNAALIAHTTLAKDSIYVEVTYNVNSTSGGASYPMQMTQTTKRPTPVSASTTTNINPPGTRAVAVTPVGATATQLPSNPTAYSFNFTIQNNGNATDTYNLLASIAGAPSGAVTIVTVDGVAGTTGTKTIASGATAVVAVTYTVSGAVPAGTTDKINFKATSQADALVNSTGDLTVTVSKAAVTIVKGAFKDDQVTVLTLASLVKPGDFIQYKVSVTNGAAAAAASSVQVSDALPAQVTYISSSPDLAGWTLSQSAGTVTGTLTGTLAAGATRFFWIRVQVK